MPVHSGQWRLAPLCAAFMIIVIIERMPRNSGQVIINAASAALPKTRQ